MEGNVAIEKSSPGFRRARATREATGLITMISRIYRENERARERRGGREGERKRERKRNMSLFIDIEKTLVRVKRCIVLKFAKVFKTRE